MGEQWGWPIMGQLGTNPPMLPGESVIAPGSPKMGAIGSCMIAISSCWYENLQAFYEIYCTKICQ